MHELSDEDRAYLAGVAAGVTLVLVVLWLRHRAKARVRRDVRLENLKFSVDVLSREIEEQGAELEALKSRLPQEVAE